MATSGPPSRVVRLWGGRDTRDNSHLKSGEEVL